MAEVCADKDSHHWPIQVDDAQPAPPVDAADKEQKVQHLLNFAKELLEAKGKQVADLRTEADQTTNALLQICGIYFAFVGLLLSVVANGANIKCRHLWSPIVLCTLGSIGFWIAFCYLVFVFSEKEFRRQKLVDNIGAIENCKTKVSGNLDTIPQNEFREKAVNLGLITKKPTPNKIGKPSIWEAKVKKFDARAKGLFFFVFFLGGLALVAAYFAVTFSIVQILCH